MKALAFAFAGATLLAAAPASAATTIVFDGSVGLFGNSSVTTSPFSDTYTLTLTQSGYLGLNVGSTVAINPRTGVKSRDLDFTSVTISGGSLPSAVNFVIDSMGDVENRSYLSGQILAKGVYTIAASGIVRGLPASYGGEISFFAAGVPEPATWGLMILGFGMVGGAMRRRAVKTAVRFA